MAADPRRILQSKDLPSTRCLGKGLSGFIYETTWLGKRYARKDFPLGSLKRNYVFEREAKSLLDLDHPNIVKCLGYTVGKSSCSLLQEYVDDNLQSIIEKRKEAQRKSKLFSSGSTSHGSRILDVDEIKRSISNQDMAVGSKMSESATPFKLPEAVDIMLQIATGMKYLHDNEIVHGDLKPNNVLLYISTSGQMIVKLADYGLVETKKRIKLVSKRTRHFEVLMWKAPERLEELLGPVSKNSEDPFTESDTDSDEEMESSVNFEMAMADVYSFGLICLHILGGELQDPDLSLTRLREQRMKPIRPGPPSACPNYLRSMILSSLEPQSSRTPTFSSICSLLKASQSVQLPVLIKGMSSATASARYTAGSTSTSTQKDGEPSELTSSMDALPDVVLIRDILAKLPLFDMLRARAVCKRWQEISHLHSFDSQDEGTTAPKSYCPLIFKRNSLQHLWCGYDSTNGTWEPLPPLTNLPQVDIRPLAGNGKGLMGFKITSAMSQVVVGNPFTSEWQTIPTSTETWGEVGNVLVVDGSASFQIIAVREDSTEIFHSKVDAWTKLRERPPAGLQEITVMSLKDKLITGTLCGGLLFCYGGDSLVSFDVVREKWTEDHIRLPPHSSPKCFQMLECGGNLFAAIEDVARHTVFIWGLGLRRREFFVVADMPQHLYSLLCKRKRGGKHTLVQLKAVGHKHRMYFWRKLSHDIVVFDFLRRTWAELPQFDQCFHHPTADQSEPAPDDFQTFVDTGSFEPAQVL